MRGSNRFDVFDAGHPQPALVHRAVTAPTSSALGSRPSAFQRHCQVSGPRAPLGSSGQHNRRANEFPDPSCRATDMTTMPRPLNLTMPSDFRTLAQPDPLCRYAIIGLKLTQDTESQMVDQCLGCFEVSRLDTLGETIKDGGQELVSLLAPPLIAP